MIFYQSIRRYTKYLSYRYVVKLLISATILRAKHDRKCIYYLSVTSTYIYPTTDNADFSNFYKIIINRIFVGYTYLNEVASFTYVGYRREEGLKDVPNT